MEGALEEVVATRLSLPATPAEVATTTRVGSMARVLLRIVYAHAHTHGVGMTARELTDAFERGANRPPEHLAGTLGWLKRRGILASSGRRGHYRFHPPGFVESDAARIGIRCDSEIVADALRLACARVGTWVPTALIQRELEIQGWTLQSASRGPLSNVLNGMGKRRLHDARGVGGGAEDGGVGIVGRGVVTAVGTERWFWAPADQASLPMMDPPVATRSDAAAVVARELATRAGRPVTLRELWLYLQRLPALHPCRYFLSDCEAVPGREGRWGGGRHLARAFTNCAHLASVAVATRGLDARHVCVFSHRSAYYASGSAFVRYFAASDVPKGGAPAVPGAAAVHLDDFAANLLPDAETEGLARLAAEVTAAESAALSPWIEARRRALSRAVADLLRHAPADPTTPRPGGQHAWSPAAWEAWLRSAGQTADAADRLIAALSNEARASGANIANAERLALSRRVRQRRKVLDAVVPVLGPALDLLGRPECRRQADMALGTAGECHSIVTDPARLVPVHAVRTWLSAYVAWGGLPGGLGTGLAPGDGATAIPESGSLDRQAAAAVQNLLLPCRRFRDEAGLVVRAARAMRGEGRRGGNQRGTTGLVALPRVPALLDRVEALVASADVQRDAWTRSLLRRAAALLGPIARSTAAFDRCLDRAVASDALRPAIRRRVIIAGGLLGATGTLTAAEALLGGVGARADGDLDVRTAALACALAGPDVLAALLDSPGFRALPPTYTERVAKVRRRARGGFLFSVGAP